MSLQEFLTAYFCSWQPPAPVVTARTSSSITLRWENIDLFKFVKDDFLYRVEVRTKIPAWTIVYSGGKTTKTIENLASSHPQKFRLRVILKTEAVSCFADKAFDFFGSDEEVYKIMKNINLEEDYVPNMGNTEKGYSKHIMDEERQEQGKIFHWGIGSKMSTRNDCKKVSVKKWLESRYSAETWTGTDTEGSTPACFCMAVHCGYIKQGEAVFQPRQRLLFNNCQVRPYMEYYSHLWAGASGCQLNPIDAVQKRAERLVDNPKLTGRQLITMLEERPALIEIINPSNGFTPLATAVRKGDINTVKFLLSSGADVNQSSLSGQAPVHLAVLHGYTDIVDLLLDRGANFQAKDLISCQVEHYAVDSGSLEMLQHVFSRGGDVTVVDNKLWTPLFRAVCQGSKTEIIQELVVRGSDLSVVDRRGLTIPHAAKLLKNRHGGSRNSILRLVDPQFPHEQAFANFTRLTKKISSLNTLFK